MTIILLLALAWFVANAALVLMLRRNARVREREPGHASRASHPSRPAMGRMAGRL